MIDPIASVAAADARMPSVVADASTLRYRAKPPVFADNVPSGAVQADGVQQSSSPAPVASVDANSAATTGAVVDAGIEMPNVMLAADMVAVNIATMQRAQTTYQASMLLAASSAEQPPESEVRPADSAAATSY